MKTILVPIDFSAASERVVAEALALAKLAGARLVLLHVLQLPVMTDSDAGPQMSADYAAAAAESAARRLAACKKSIRAKAVPVTTEQRVGAAGQCIVERARALRASYIVLGSHGHGAFYDLIVGSTASRVLKQARCPVVIVPLQKEKPRN